MFLWKNPHLLHGKYYLQTGKLRVESIFTLPNVPIPIANPCCEKRKLFNSQRLDTPKSIRKAICNT